MIVEKQKSQIIIIIVVTSVVLQQQNQHCFANCTMSSDWVRCRRSKKKWKKTNISDKTIEMASYHLDVDRWAKCRIISIIMITMKVVSLLMMKKTETW